MNKSINKGFLVLLIFGWHVSFFAQTKPVQQKTDSLSNTKASEQLRKKDDDFSTEKTVPDYESISPAPHIFINSKEISLRDYRAGLKVDSIWQSKLLSSDLYPEMRKSIVELPEEKQKLTVKDYKQLPTDTLKERLKRLDEKTPFKITYTPELEKMIHFYLRRDKNLMEDMMSLSRYYFPLFENELAKHDLPLELKYLPIIESALNPRAKSRVGATGLWQFMFSTGRAQGLTISSYVDERMDPVKSTRAAVEYLSELYDAFGNWDLVLASYNSGPGSVSKAMRRSGGKTNYWNLRTYLPGETANYVPAFLAAYYVFNYADEHNYKPYNPQRLYFETDTVQIKETIKFEQIAKVTGIDKELLAFLNPEYKLGIIPHIKGKHYSVRLPIREAGLFVANEDKIYKYTEEKLADEKLPSYYQAQDKIRYRVKRGDYLGSIAGRYGVSVSRIKHWNHMRSNTLRAGQYLTIYPKKPVAVKKSSLKTVQKKTRPTSKKTYVVQKGDSLWSISRKKGISVSQIREWNDISGSQVKPGMRLKISEG